MDEHSPFPFPQPEDTVLPDTPQVKQEVDDDLEIVDSRPVNRSMSIDPRSNRSTYDEGEVSDSDTFTTNGAPLTPMRRPYNTRSGASLRTPRTPNSAVFSRSTGCTEQSSTKMKGKGSGLLMTPLRQRRAPIKTPTVGTKISKSYEEMSDEDYLLLTMKDSGHGWEEIRSAWQDLTGQETAKSTLPNRYSRLKANLTNLSDDDLQNLVDAKAEIELEFEQEMWSRIQQRMAEKGTPERYTVEFLKKQLARVDDYQHTAAADRTARTHRGGFFESFAAPPSDMDTAE